jgi:hypothetical protein
MVGGTVESLYAGLRWRCKVDLPLPDPVENYSREYYCDGSRHWESASGSTVSTTSRADPGVPEIGDYCLFVRDEPMSELLQQSSRDSLLATLPAQWFVDELGYRVYELRSGTPQRFVALGYSLKAPFGLRHLVVFLSDRRYREYLVCEVQPDGVLGERPSVLEYRVFGKPHGEVSTIDARFAVENLEVNTPADSEMFVPKLGRFSRYFDEVSGSHRVVAEDVECYLDALVKSARANLESSPTSPAFGYAALRAARVLIAFVGTMAGTLLAIAFWNG